MPIRKVSFKFKGKDGKMYPYTKKVNVRRTNSNRRRPVGRASIKRKSDYARVVEAQELPIVTDLSGVATFNFTTQLSEFNRSQEVAHAYKYYRCAKVELEFVPYATFAITNGTTAGRMPQLYFTIDRVNNMWQTANEAEMLERGILPKLFKRNYKYSWKPNLLQHVQLETNQARDGTGQPLGIDTLNAVNSIPLFDKWLPTQQSGGFKIYPGTPNITAQQVTQAAGNPYNLKYYGAVAVIDIEGGNAQQIGDLMIKVTWEFKGPRVLKSTTPVNGIEPSYTPATSIMNPAVVPNTQPTTYP